MTDRAPRFWLGGPPSRVLARMRRAGGELVEAKQGIVRSTKGHEFVDLRSGLWNALCGHGLEDINAAVEKQLWTMSTGSKLNWDHVPAIAEEYCSVLHDQLKATASSGSVYPSIGLVQSGSSAVECAVLASIRYQRQLGLPERTNVASIAGSFHGFGIVAGSLSGDASIAACMGTRWPGAVQLRRPDVQGRIGAEQLVHELDELDALTVSALVLEPICGSDLWTLGPDGLSRLFSLLDERGILTIADEIATGFFRAGSLAHTLACGLSPDILLLGKNITNGVVPLSAVALSGRVADSIVASDEFFPFGSTGDANPLSVAAALATIRLTMEPSFAAILHRSEAMWRTGLEQAASTSAALTGVRSFGHMFVLTIGGAATDSWEDALVLQQMIEAEGAILTVTPGHMEIYPSIAMSKGVVDLACGAIRRGVERFTSR